MKLENWSTTAGWDGATRVQGLVSGNPRFADGTFVTTTTVVSINRDERTVTTRSGSVYGLGLADPEWCKLYPNADARFFAPGNGAKTAQ